METVFFKSRKRMLIIDNRYVLADYRIPFCMPLYCDWFIMTKPYIFQAPVDFRSFLIFFDVSKLEFCLSFLKSIIL